MTPRPIHLPNFYNRFVVAFVGTRHVPRQWAVTGLNTARVAAARRATMGRTWAGRSSAVSGDSDSGGHLTRAMCGRSWIGVRIMT